MKICYVDETGTNRESPLVVMVGIIADSHRLSRTRTEFKEVMERLEKVPGRAIRELKSSELYRGKKLWGNVDGEVRHALIRDLCEWLCKRKHYLALAAIDKETASESPLPELDDHWMSAAIHVALQVQRYSQKKSDNKGHTFLVFDENKRLADPLAEMLFTPPSWTDEYYQRDKKKEALDQIIDSAFYARSHHVGLVQVADLFAFIFRRYSELRDYNYGEKFSGEAEMIDSWVKLISSRLLDRSERWPQRPKSEVACWFYNAAPPSLANL